MYSVLALWRWFQHGLADKVIVNALCVISIKLQACMLDSLTRVVDDVQTGDKLKG